MENADWARAARNFRALSIFIICGMGLFVLTILFFGLALGGPFEPLNGITGYYYYTLESLARIIALITYISMIIAVPHSWIIQLRSRYMTIMGILFIPIFWEILNFSRELYHALRYGALWGDYIPFLVLYGAIFSFFGLPILSLYYSWETRAQ